MFSKIRKVKEFDSRLIGYYGPYFCIQSASKN